MLLDDVYALGLAQTCQMNVLTDDFDELADRLAEELEKPEMASDDDEEKWQEGLLDGLAVARFLAIRSKVDTFGHVNPACRYCGDLVCYIWDEGTDYRTLVADINNEPIVYFEYAASDCVTSSNLDEDEYSVAARYALDLMGEDEDEDFSDDLSAADIDDDGDPWVSTSYAARFEVK